MFNMKSHRTLSDNISTMFLATSVSLIVSELTSVFALFVDGILTSRFLGPDVYSGISISRPYISIVFRIAGVLSAACMIGCSRYIGAGKRDEANRVFNLTVLLGVVFSVLLVGAIIFLPEQTLTLCGVDLDKYPELLPHIFGYLKGYLPGIPAVIFITLLGPVIVMDNGRSVYTLSSFVVMIADIVFDLLNVFVIHGGAFGMGMATALASLIQFAMLLVYQLKQDSYFKISLRSIIASNSASAVTSADKVDGASAGVNSDASAGTSHLIVQFAKDGFPSLVKKAATSVAEILINHITIVVAVTTAALAAKGIQSDIYMLLYCIPEGMCRALTSMTGIYYSANDRKGLTYLYSYAIKLGFTLTVIPAVLVFVASPLIARIYTGDPDVIELTITSLKWLAVSMLCTTSISLIQGYEQGTQQIDDSNKFNISNRLTVPVLVCFILGNLYGSVGVLASGAVTDIIFLVIIFVSNCYRNKGLPKDWLGIMFLPKDFGGADADNLYGTIETLEDATRESEKARLFCLDHGTGTKTAMLVSLFVEEMSVNVILHSKDDKKTPRSEYRLYIKDDKILLSMMDLGRKFDPVSYYKMHGDEDPARNIGIRIVMKEADDVQYFNSFNSNNLLIALHRN